MHERLYMGVTGLATDVMVKITFMIQNNLVFFFYAIVAFL
jgi:hypothetical protein